MRAIPGRRWDPQERVWRVPLDPERAQALVALFASVPGGVEVTDALARALERRAGKRRRDECVLDLARPDQAWWLSFPTDVAADVVEALLEHPGAWRVPAIGRALIPLDEHAARLVRGVLGQTSRLRLTDDAIHALVELAQRPPEHAHLALLASEVELRRDRRGGQWILIAAQHAPLARVLAGNCGLRVLDGPAGTLALAAIEQDALRTAEVLEQLDTTQVDPRVQEWIDRATSWHGTIEVQGGANPAFVLLGDVAPLPAALRERTERVEGGATVPLTLDSWRLMDGELRGWISAPTRVERWPCRGRGRGCRLYGHIRPQIAIGQTSRTTAAPAEKRIGRGGFHGL